MLEDLSAFFGADEFAETVVVNGVPVSAIVDTSTELLFGEVLAPAPSLLLPAASVPSASEGQPCTVRGVAHRIREVRQEPPDGALVRLVLVRG